MNIFEFLPGDNPLGALALLFLSFVVLGATFASLLMRTHKDDNPAKRVKKPAEQIHA
jgi:hypothetical protein